MSLLLVSDNVLVRERWQTIVQQHYQVIEATTLFETEAVISSNRLEAILFHRQMADIEAIIKLAEHPLMVLADVPDDYEAVILFRAGVLGYASTYLSANRLLQAVQTAISGQVWIGQSLMQRIIKGATSKAFKRGEPDQPAIDITDREWEIAVLVGKGRSNLEIAADLDISERTVKAHIGSIFKKTGTQSRLQLALLIRNHVSKTA